MCTSQHGHVKFCRELHRPEYVVLGANLWRSGWLLTRGKLLAPLQQLLWLPRDDTDWLVTILLLETWETWEFVHPTDHRYHV